MTISIRRYLASQPITKRGRKAVRYIRERIAHYTKTNEENVKISMELNSRIVKHYSKRMTPVKMSIDVDKGVALAKPFEDPRAAEMAKREGSEFSRRFGKVLQGKAAKAETAKPKG